MGVMLKVVYGLIMVGVVAIVIGGKIPSIGTRFIASNPADQGGDLYRLCELDRFREQITFASPTPTAPITKAEIFTLGDSFFNSALGSDFFANELAAKGGFPVHNLASDGFFEPHSYPLAYLNFIGFRPERRRILILETAERNSLDRTASYDQPGGTSANRLNTIAFKVLKNNDVEFFFKNNMVTHPIIKLLKNVRFEWFGVIDKAIGAYSLDPAMLFYQRDIEFAASAKSDAVLNAAADRVATVAAKLRRLYSLELLYVVVPDKYSVYRDYVRKSTPYDRYIPRLIDKLRQRGVHAVDLYGAYMDHRRTSTVPLYYVSDSHYNALGKTILVEECLREISAMKGDGYRPSAGTQSDGHQ